jgi:energy-coupling factor transporter ATP-binding protein EcfA2
MTDATATPPEAPAPDAAAPPPPSGPSAVAPADPAPAAASPSASAEDIIRTPMSRLTAIEIRNYRGYRGTFRLELPKGENLLVYGENGAGKSSLFHTLKTFLEAPELRVVEVDASNRKISRPIKITDHQHRFTTAEPGVKLEFGKRAFEWTGASNDTGSEIVRLLNQAKGFLDYKALLEVHYLRVDEKQEIDLFPLLMRSLLPHYTYAPPAGTSRTYTKGLELLRAEAKKSWSPEWRRKRKTQELQKSLDAYNEALEKAIHDLGERASAMLETFGDDFRVLFKYEKAYYDTWPKRVEAPKVLAVPAFRRQQFPDYHSVLNEARLSALAICLFLAAVKQSPATQLRLLVLDDILIGLDMGNRVKVVDLIQEHFKNTDDTNWQIVILTYSKAWFERLKDHLHKTDISPAWKSVVLWEEWRTEDPSPHTVGKDISPHVAAESSGTLIEMADRHLLHKDYKAAAVYARSALEALCNYTCAKANLAVVHVTNPKQRQLEDYITVLESRLGELHAPASRQEAVKLIARLREAQAFVLNRNSHFDPEEEDPLSGEVKSAIQTVKDLTDFFEKLSWKKTSFKSGQILSATERMIIELAEARKLARFGPKHGAITALARAHHLAWEAYGLREKVALPIGEPLRAKAIWNAAQPKLDPALDARLKAGRPYLFGDVDENDFDPAKFEEAAKLVEELSGNLGPSPPPAAPPHPS